jgi:hypothetical protein
MKERTSKSIEAARANHAAGCLVPYEDVIVDLAAEVDRLTLTLHCRQAHPDFEYETTQTARKSGDDPWIGLEGDGWEPNDIVPCHVHVDGSVIREHCRNWERFQFHEDNYWRRRKSS